MALKTTTVRVEDQTLERLDKLAESMARSRSWLISQAIQKYLDYEEWFVQAVTEGIRAADEGRVVKHTAVRDWVESWDTDHERERPECE